MEAKGAIHEAKDLGTMTMEELLWSPINYEHTLQIDTKKMETTKKKKKDLALWILLQEYLDKEMNLLTRSFKKFLKERVRGSSSRRQEEDFKIEKYKN